jgi:hypothetical protein
MEEQFEIIITGDGSPSLKPAGEGSYEIMHHSAGAFSETQYIYIDPLRWAVVRGAQRVFSLGLGLGYHELGFLKVSEELKFKENRNLEMTSFESSNLLRKYFFEHLEGTPNFLSESFQAVSVMQGFDKNSDWLSLLKQAVEYKQLQIHGALQRPFLSDLGRYQVVFYDAYSRKTSPVLWEPEFLSSFVDHFCDSNCVWLTYACLGPLKRALLDKGFELWVRPGFNGKRNATWAVRGAFIPDFKSLKTSSHTQ